MTNSSNTCPNCESVNSPEANFCLNCGQKRKLRILSVWSIISDFFSSIFNYDSKIFTTLRGVFIPGFLTNQFLTNKRVSYFPPARTFIFLMFIFFAMLFKESGQLTLQSSTNENDDVVITGGGDDSIYDLMEQGYVELRYDKLISKLRYEFNNQIELSEKKIKVLEKSQSEKVKSVLKSSPESLKEQIQQLKESIVKLDEIEKDLNIDRTKTTNIKLVSTKTYDINIFDISNMPINQLIEKYEVSGFFETLLMNQALRLNKNATAFRDFIVKNLPWAILLEVLLISMVGKLFYIRTKRKYVEHFVFFLNLRSMIFVTGIIAILLPLSYGYWFWSILAVFIWLFSFISMLKVYRQSIFITLIKNIGLVIIDTVILFLSIILVVIASSLLFGNI